MRIVARRIFVSSAEELGLNLKALDTVQLPAEVIQRPTRPLPEGSPGPDETGDVTQDAIKRPVIKAKRNLILAARRDLSRADISYGSFRLLLLLALLRMWL